MHINASQFCGLSSSAAFLAWLHDTFPDLCAILTAKLRAGASCSKNTAAMMDVFKSIVHLPDGEVKLRAFLLDKFPHVLAGNQQANVDPVFGDFDPKLLTVPRRAILFGSRATEAEVQKIVAGKPAYDFLIVNGRAYVEYVPVEQAKIVKSIPEKNWLIKKWRRHNRQN